MTVTIRDVNDEAPSFNRREYSTSVPENVADGTPLGGLDLVVRDTDVVSEGRGGVWADWCGRRFVERDIGVERNVGYCFIIKQNVL